MAKIENFEDLEVWKLARDICVDAFSFFKTTPLGNDYALRNQMDRSSGSIMDNIAEGFERDGSKEFRHYLSISKGSCGELRSQLYRCFDREHIDEKQFEELKEKTIVEGKKIGSFINYLNKTEYSGNKFK